MGGVCVEGVGVVDAGLGSLLSQCLLQGNEKRIYELVVRHFLACCSKVCRNSYIISCVM